MRSFYSILFLFLPAAQAATIISIGGNASAYFNLAPPAGSQVLATSWTTGATYSNVSILATLFDNSELNAAGIAYLTKAIGPTATTASLIDSAPFTIGPGATAIELLSESVLSPATYYLVLVGTSSNADFGWLSPSTATLFAGPGVIEGSRYYANPGFNSASSINSLYAPGSTFVNFDNSSSRLLFSVVASDVPEPAFGILAGILLAAVVLSRRSRLS